MILLNKIFFTPTSWGTLGGVKRGPKGPEMTKIDLIRERLHIFVYFPLQKCGKNMIQMLKKNYPTPGGHLEGCPRGPYGLKTETKIQTKIGNDGLNY